MATNTRLNSLKLSGFHWLTALGSYILFCVEVFKRMVFPPPNFRLVMQQMEFVGVKSFWIIVLAAIMIGAVFGIQFGSIFRLFGAESMIGAAASFALSKELAPVIGSFLVTGRGGSSMAAEIATMKVNEQIDAIQVMAVNPIAYLATPRVLASMIMMPLLCGFFIICGILSCYIIGVKIFAVDVGIFMEKIRWITTPNHIIQGMEKAVVFGALFSSIGCYKGFTATGGAKGVGEATTSAVVLSLVCILVVDFVISYFQLEAVF